MSETVIGICDDQKISVMLLMEYLRDLRADLQNTNWKVLTFLSAAEMLKVVREINILFLDIDMPVMDGIEAGKQIAELNPDCRVIMATSRLDRVKEAFHIHAIRFITKPFDREEIKEALQASLDVDIGEHLIEMFRDRISYRIKEKNVKYVRAFNGYVEIAAGKSIFRKDVTLDEMEKSLDRRLFFRIHRQYLVNLKYVDDFSKNEITMGGIRLPVSKRRQTDFMSCYTDFDLNYRYRL
ncbi:MAG: LytR/AlgR family response regulator transcription factor [Bilifractor sp.]|jgi:DNA-binding LytR/AlgR family response regulator